MSNIQCPIYQGGAGSPSTPSSKVWKPFFQCLETIRAHSCDSWAVFSNLWNIRVHPCPSVVESRSLGRRGHGGGGVTGEEGQVSRIKGRRVRSQESRLTAGCN